MGEWYALALNPQAPVAKYLYLWGLSHHIFLLQVIMNDFLIPLICLQLFMLHEKGGRSVFDGHYVMEWGELYKELFTEA